MEKIKKLLCLCVLFWGVKGWTQQCPEPISPRPGDLVPPDATISWTPVEGVPSYLIQLGTTEGGSEILPLTSRGQATQYKPPQGLPENDTIYVELYVFNTLINNTIRCASYYFRTDSYTSPPGCTELVNPVDGQQNVPIQSSISWNYSPGATEYVVSLSTSDGEFIVQDRLVTDLFLNPEDITGDLLPPEEEITVEITPRNSLGEAAGCDPFRFTTGPLATLPGCTTILYPSDGEFDVPLSPEIRWSRVEEAEGYRVSIGTSPTQNDIIDNGEYRNQTEIGIIDFEPNRQYFVTIIPFNIAGEAIGCETTSFYTLLGCGPFFDTDGELVDFSPEITFPEVVGICSSGGIPPITASDPADGYRWFRIENDNREIPVGEGPEFTPQGPGEYRLEIYDEITDPSGVVIECASSRVFTVTQSEPAIIERTNVNLGAGVLSIEVIVSGIGDYEFALNNPEGPYQDSNRFTGLAPDNYRVFVRDRKGCGITEVLVEPDLTLEGFPKFFTPNGDGVNDFWQFILPDSGINPIRQLFIFDRYGNLLAQVDPQSVGWDGTFNGKPMPASDYWFRAIDTNNREIRGHLSLKR